ncbi:MAG: DNA-directed RNA polymerase subunit alpha, partial [Anaerolineales bacterium]
LYLFSVDDQSVHLEIEMTVERGRGYSPVDDRIGRLPIGELPVDAIYSPVKRVNWEVGYARVGQSTNFDSLIIDIWTDGTIGPEDALSTSAKILIDHLRHLAGVSEETLAAMEEAVEEGGRLTSEMIETPIENLDLSVRVFNSLKRTGITTVGEVIELLEKGDEAVMSIRNFGEKSLDELRLRMREKGYLKDENEIEVE